MPKRTSACSENEAAISAPSQRPVSVRGVGGQNKREWYTERNTRAHIAKSHRSTHPQPDVTCEHPDSGVQSAKNSRFTCYSWSSFRQVQ